MNKFLFLMTVLVTALASEEKYPEKYDTLNVDDILNSDRLLTSYHKCLMDTGPCTPEGNELKKIIPEALTNECAKCTETQKENTEKVIKYLLEKQHEMWKDLEEKYDPKNVFKKKYGKFAHDHGIEV